MVSIVDTGQVQTQRMYSYMKAKHAATSGSQLASRSYFGDEGEKILYNEFELELKVEIALGANQVNSHF